jgi:phosphate starvation-inducible PhoH-like protein
MFLTRLGEGSHMAITGDPSQVDLPPGAGPGLSHAVQTLEHIDAVRVVRFTDVDIVRHSLVTKIVQAYEKDDQKQKSKEKDRSRG